MKNPFLKGPETSVSQLGLVSRKSRELFGLEKPFVKLRPAYSVKLTFSYVVKEIKIKITAKFRASRRLRFEDTTRIVSPEIRPKSFGTFEKRAPAHLSKFQCSLLRLVKLHIFEYQKHRITNLIVIVDIFVPQSKLCKSKQTKYLCLVRWSSSSSFSIIRLIVDRHIVPL